ncbi:hypothetical protein GCM10009599_19250 [Luteococcus peritonei]
MRSWITTSRTLPTWSPEASSTGRPRIREMNTADEETLTDPIYPSDKPDEDPAASSVSAPQR